MDPVKTEEQEYSDAFSQAASIVSGDKPEPAKEDEVKAPETKEPEEKTVEAKAPVETEATTEEAPLDEPQKAPEGKAPVEKAPEEAPEVKTLKEQLAAKEAELAEAKKVTPAPVQAAPEGKAPEKPAEVVTEKPKAFEPSADQKAATDWLEIEFPEVAKAITAREAALTYHYEQRTTELLKEFGKQISELLAPVVGTHLQSEQERHLSEIRGAVPDFDTVQPLLEPWIKTLPRTAQETMQKVFEEGDSQSVVWMVNSFKAATGRTSPQQQSPDPKPAAPQTVAAPPAEKVNALTVVKGGRTQPKTASTVDPEDYEAAFRIAAESAEAQLKR